MSQESANMRPVRPGVAGTHTLSRVRVADLPAISVVYKHFNEQAEVGTRDPRPPGRLLRWVILDVSFCACGAPLPAADAVRVRFGQTGRIRSIRSGRRRTQSCARGSPATCSRPRSIPAIIDGGCAISRRSSFWSQAVVRPREQLPQSLEARRHRQQRPLSRAAHLAQTH